MEAQTVRGVLASGAERGRPVPLEEAAELLRATARALAEAAPAGPLPTPLRPEALEVATLPGGRRQVTLRVDRPLPAATSAVEQPSAFREAHAYLAPEGQPGPAADLYALGVVAFELLAGRVPFWAEDAPALQARHRDEPPPSLQALRPEVPPALDAVVRKLLAKSKENRFASVDEAHQALVEATAGLGPPRSSDSPVARRVAVGAGVVLAALLGGLGVSSWPGAPAPQTAATLEQSFRESAELLTWLAREPARAEHFRAALRGLRSRAAEPGRVLAEVKALQAQLSLEAGKLALEAGVPDKARSLLEMAAASGFPEGKEADRLLQRFDREVDIGRVVARAQEAADRGETAEARRLLATVEDARLHGAARQALKLSLARTLPAAAPGAPPLPPRESAADWYLEGLRLLEEPDARLQEAHAAFTRCLKGLETHVDCRLARAEVALALGDRRAAQEDLRAVLELAPDNERARALRKH